MGSMVVVEMGELVSMEVGAEGVGGGGVVVDASELREATGVREGAAVPTRCDGEQLQILECIGHHFLELLHPLLSIPIDELGVEFSVGELIVVEDRHGGGCGSCDGNGGGARVSVDAEAAVAAVVVGLWLGGDGAAVVDRRRWRRWWWWWWSGSGSDRHRQELRGGKL
jgi:hypothetical protein